MAQIFFPANYKKALLSGKKTMTIRFDGELGKYKKGQFFSVFSYAGRDWNARVCITNVARVSFLQLDTLKIRRSSIARIIKERGGERDFLVEIINFKLN